MYSLGQWVENSASWLVPVMSVLWVVVLLIFWRKTSIGRLCFAAMMVLSVGLASAYWEFNRVKELIILETLEVSRQEKNPMLDLPEHRCLILYRREKDSTREKKVGFCYKLKFEDDPSVLKEFFLTLKASSEKTFSEE